MTAIAASWGPTSLIKNDFDAGSVYMLCCFDLDFNWKVALKIISTVIVALKCSYQLISSED